MIAFLLFFLLVEDRTIYVGVNPTTFESQLIQDELTRNWTQLNSKVELDATQIISFKELGEHYNKIREDLNVKFEFIDYAHIPPEIECPCIKIGKYGNWEEIDKRAFQTTTMPLLTVIWMYKIHFRIEDEIKQKKIHDESYAKWVMEFRKVFEINNKIMKEAFPDYESFYFVKQSTQFFFYNTNKSQWREDYPFIISEFIFSDRVVDVIGYTKIYREVDVLYEKENKPQIIEPHKIKTSKLVLDKLIPFPAPHKTYKYVIPKPPWEENEGVGIPTPSFSNF